MICLGNEFYQGFLLLSEKFHLVVCTIGQDGSLPLSFRSSAHEESGGTIFHRSANMDFYVVATIRCLISLALLFTKLMMSAWCSVSLF